jgi:hypothetical protein
LLCGKKQVLQYFTKTSPQSPAASRFALGRPEQLNINSNKRTISQAHVFSLPAVLLKQSVTFFKYSSFVYFQAPRQKKKTQSQKSRLY